MFIQRRDYSILLYFRESCKIIINHVLSDPSVGVLKQTYFLFFESDVLYRAEDCYRFLFFLTTIEIIDRRINSKNCERSR